MIYFQPKSDLKFFMQLRDNALKLWDIEAEEKNFTCDVDFRIHGQRGINIQSNEYQKIREQIAKATKRAIEISQRLGVPIHVNFGTVSPSTGTPVFPGNFIEAILNDPFQDVVEKQTILDKINQIIGALESSISQDFWRLINPFYWLKELFLFVIRIPFLLIKASGFNITKIEETVIGKAFKLIEIFVLLYLFVRLGFSKDQIQQVMTNLIFK